MNEWNFKEQISIFDYLSDIERKEEPELEKGLKLYEVNRADIYEWNVTGSKWTTSDKSCWIYDLLNNEATGHNIMLLFFVGIYTKFDTFKHTYII